MTLVSFTRDKALAFGALLTKILKNFKVSFVSEPKSHIASNISEYTINQVGGGDVLLVSMAATDVPMDDPQHHLEVAMPQPQQQPPAYWTDFTAMEQEHYNQPIQWEQQMATQMNSISQQFGALNTRVDHIETRMDAIYQYHFPLPPPNPEQ
ncbi:hypothetical protein CsSME_00048342 [Camellia sinensis var. sinensis]